MDDREVGRDDDGPKARYRRTAGAFTTIVRGTEDWDAPTPVAGWSARDVVGHLVGWVPGLLAGAGVELAGGPDVGDDPVGAWTTHARSVLDLLDDPATATRTLDNPNTGSMPLAEAVDRFVTPDVFLHRWDLARATGQDDHLDPDRCAEMLTGMRRMEDVLRSSGHYGPAVPVPADADVQDRLMGFIGRDPGWRPPAAA